MPIPRRRFEPRQPAPSATPQLGRLVVGLVLILALMYIAWHKANEPPAQPGAQPGAQNAPPPSDANRPVRVKILSPEEQAKFREGRTGIESTETPASDRAGDDQTQSESPPPAASEPSTATSDVVTSLKNQKIRDQNGKVIYTGTVELADTLERISRGERGSHGNDGSVFQNRERRLPQKPSGYYREWVHPTPKQRGPGPQRIVTGEGGEIYYTPDHYETFQRLDRAGERK